MWPIVGNHPDHNDNHWSKACLVYKLFRLIATLWCALALLLPRLSESHGRVPSHWVVLKWPRAAECRSCQGAQEDAVLMDGGLSNSSWYWVICTCSRTNRLAFALFVSLLSLSLLAVNSWISDTSFTNSAQRSRVDDVTSDSNSEMIIKALSSQHWMSTLELMHKSQHTASIVDGRTTLRCWRRMETPPGSCHSH